ncbi:DUF3267 domain-containing protein [Sporosarcina sp. CAU 1771]
MNEFPKPNLTIELDLPDVARKSLYLTGLAFIVLLVVSFILGNPFRIDWSFLSLIQLTLGYVVLIALHEFFHLFGFRVFAHVPWKRMEVGLNLKLGIAYATTDKLMANQDIRKALLLPFWMTGILPAIVGLYLGSGVLLILAALLIGGAAGDFVMYKELKKVPGDWLIKDDPKLPKLYIYSPDKVEKAPQPFTNY